MTEEVNSYQFCGRATARIARSWIEREQDPERPVPWTPLSKPLSEINGLLASAKGVAKDVRKRSLARFVADMATVGDVLGCFGADPVAYLAARRDLKAGRMIVLVDDESRENEGDLIVSTSKGVVYTLRFGEVVTGTEDEISAAILPYLEAVMAGPAAWAGEPTLDRAIELRDGGIVNPAIARFQHRAADYPHPIQGDR